MQLKTVTRNQNKEIAQRTTAYTIIMLLVLTIVYGSLTKYCMEFVVKTLVTKGLICHICSHESHSPSNVHKLNRSETHIH